tara:strand:+ start:2108 stop:2815 length:708 start_codon:yes stop_codon:yes gene_type:complete
MKKIIISILSVFALNSGVAIADESKITKGYFTPDAMGCMLLRECTDGVEQVFSLLDVSSQYPNTDDFYPIANEFNRMLVALNQIGVNVFLADQKYFPVGHRGVYHTVGNNFFLNKAFMGRPSVLMSVMRHEGWHVAQDCMAGTIDNSMIAIIMDEDKVPQIWQDIATKTYQFQPSAIPWEKEAFWAGKTEGMTQKALESCARGEMWNDYEPTPLTKQWLEENGYIKLDGTRYNTK